MTSSTLSSAYASLELLDDARAFLLRNDIETIDREKKSALENAIAAYSEAQSTLAEIVFAIENQIG